MANRDKYKAYFQMLPSSVNLVPAIVSVCKQYNWRHVGIISQDENVFNKVCMYTHTHTHTHTHMYSGLEKGVTWDKWLIFRL